MRCHAPSFVVEPKSCLTQSSGWPRPSVVSFGMAIIVTVMRGVREVKLN